MRTIIFTTIIIINLFLISGCTKDDNTIEYDPEQIIVSIDARSLEADNSLLKYLVVENRISKPLFLEIKSGVRHTIKRGKDIIGNTINIHFIYFYDSNLIDLDHLEINSYLDIPIGKEITLDGNSLPKQSKDDPFPDKTMVDISFTDIPDFDVATRSAYIPLHCHTLPTLEVPCANIGGNTYPSGNNFFVCLQSGENASYKLVEIPEVSEYAISLGDLNNQMTKYSIPKNIEQNLQVGVKAHGSDGDIKIFSYSSSYEPMFPSNSIDIFTPIGLTEMTSFSTTILGWVNGALRSNYYSPRDHVVTDYSFLEVGLSLSQSQGNFPEVSVSSNDYDMLRLEMSIMEKWCYWNLYSANPQSLYLPQFPDELISLLPLSINDFLDQADRFEIEATQDSRFDGYIEAIDHHLKINIADDQYYSTLQAYSDLRIE